MAKEAKEKAAREARKTPIKAVRTLPNKEDYNYYIATPLLTRYT